jgi:hypothetical protein
MTELLQDETVAEGYFSLAIDTVNNVAGNWDRDTIRTEPISKALFQKFGQHYPG